MVDTLIVELTGKMGSGKTTLSGNLTNELVSLGYSVTRFGFATSLKKEVMDVFGIRKDKVLEEVDLSDFPDENIKNVVLKAYEEKSPESIRRVLQQYGTEYRRNQDKDYWVKRVKEKIKNLYGLTDIIIIDDYRFMNETLEDAFRVRLTVSEDVLTQRLGYIPVDHPSERDIEYLPVHLELVNETPEDLRNNVKILIDEITNRKASLTKF